MASPSWPIPSSPHGARKRIIAQVDGMAASAGFLIASQANEIRAGRMDVVGSVGSLLVVVDASKLFEREGIEVVPITTGKFKATGLIGTEITEEQRQDLQRIVDAFGRDFVASLKRARTFTDAQVKTIAQAQVFTTSEALRLNMVDRVATLQETLRELNASGTRRRGRRTVRARVAVMAMQSALSTLCPTTRS